MAGPQGAWSLRATPLACLPVLERHAPSCLFASTPFGGPGGAQISASFAAIVCAASLAQRRTGLAPGPPSTSKVARAPPRPPAPTLGFPPPTSPPGLTPHLILSPHSTVPRDSHLSGPATHPNLAARPYPRTSHPDFLGPRPGSTKLRAPHPPHRLRTLSQASHRPHWPRCSSAFSHQRLQPTSPSQPIAPCALTPLPLLCVSFIFDSHSSCV